MLSDELHGKVVNVESPFVLSLVFPDYRFMSELDPYYQKPVIFYGKVVKNLIPKLRSMGVPFVVAATSGGEYTLTREELFEYCSPRKRKYDPVLDKVPIDEFIKLMWIMKLANKLLTEEESTAMLELYEAISNKSKDSILKAIAIGKRRSARYVITSLLTFTTRVITLNQDSSGTVSAWYSKILTRCNKRKPSFERAIRNLASLNFATDEFRLMSFVSDLVE